ncbi:SusD/RagB family nutrient-binding outer membrane lipoprotein [Chitinophaga filiformis]|uniref:SusD/RagB family nutrient-binding outer membrane lipoprotein n=1 Tax=Chitinophaga filiformis TaxID=104663 RepID=UPI001F46B317|nr:SusD/RagB family nutrient-binding outer membrane lipoprotein [Chitinophaga filiformis]MCF6401607.1 SusD/RagB family nutrient-binding outer membrane lipoprotein [Chitinophaga filiformis]
MMKKNIVKVAAGMLAALSLTITGCSKFLDINENPTKAVDVDPSYLLPSSQANIGMAIGNHFQVYGGIYSQYWTQDISSSQYRNIEQVNLDPASFDRPWQFLYAGALQDLQVIVDKANTKRLEQYAGISELLKAYSYQVLTDAFGDIPLRDAIKAGSQDILAPSYDAQEMVYDSIFAMIDRGLALIDPASTAKPAKDDLIFGGNMGNWEAFGNTLKLRAYLRLLKVDSAFAAQGIASLAGRTFLTSDAKITYVSTGGSQNPLFAEILGLGRTQNLIASSTTVDQMNALNDPRVFTFYRTTPDTFGIAGIPQGSYRTQWDYNFSAPNTAVGAYGQNDSSALAPVKFISAAESYFLQAEAAAHGYIPGDAKALYQQGITASFTAYNVAPGNYITNAVAAFPATGTEAQVKAIITQKYFAMCGNQNFEAWTEWRRTGYPSFLVRSQASVLPAGQMPQRLLYPNAEITRNPKFPGAKLAYDKVWWDAN